MEEQENGVFWKSMLRGFNLEDLLYSSSVCKEITVLNVIGIEAQAGVSLLCKVKVVQELAQNSCSSGTGTFWEPRGEGMSAIGNYYQRIGEDTLNRYSLLAD
jgi:hypothetical protein